MVPHTTGAARPAYGDASLSTLHPSTLRQPAPARDRLQYRMLREKDDGGLNIVCEMVNRYMRGGGGGAWRPWHTGTSTFSRRSLPTVSGPMTARLPTLSSCSRLWA